MRNERDDNRYEGSDDGEYHYSDDTGVDSETGSDTPRSASETNDYAKPSSGGLKKALIAGAVFIVLVGVVYKIVAPTSSGTIPEIAPLPANQANNAPQAQPTVAAPEAVAQAPQAAPMPTAPIAAPAPAQVATTIAPAPTTPAPQQQASQPPVAQNVMPIMPPQQQVAPENYPQQATQPPAPPVVVQADDMMPPMPTDASQPNIPSAATNAEIDARTSMLAAENAKLTSQLQDQYAQQIKTYQEQNKNLEEQVKILNSRVDVMQTQMNKLLFTLTQSNAPSTPTVETPPPLPGQAAQQITPPPQVVATNEPPPRVPYNVQAIIPGRAWLRSSNGETLTVAEGDQLKGFGRVVKIDPYDGVVELDINGRAVTLSYGNSGG